MLALWGILAVFGFGLLAALPPAAAAPARELTAEILYRVLVGDIALQRGEPGLAARAFYEAARDAEDPALARRATEVALFARQRPLALESAKLWATLDPSADRARQLVATLSQAGTGTDLKRELERVLAEAAANGKSLGDAFVQLNQVLATQSDKVAVFKLVVELAKPYPEIAEAPESKAATGALAQLYVEQKRYGEARALFQRLYEDDPSDRDIAFAIAALSMQMKDYAAAEPLLQELKGSGYGDPGVAAFYLAQIAEETKRYDEAIERYREVTQGERAWTAKLRIAAILAKKDSVDAARRYLDTLQAEGREQQTERVQAEAQLLRDAGDLAGAYALIERALKADPNSSDLLYDIAMIAEKLDRLDEVEQRLAHLIELKPDNAQALNALGYTLVDRTERTAEGLRLFEKALTLAPEDPFILDSMGWAQFRLGNLGDSEKFLRRALADRPDPEIAAHLGEVLWAKGERDSAQELWQSQLRSNPDNPVLLETVRRLAR